MISLKQTLSTTLLLISITALGACKTPEEKVVSERKEAAKEITSAEQNVERVRQEEAKKIAETHGAKKVEDAKIDATENIADAKKEVQDEKVEATKEVVDAEQKAKKDAAPAVP
jgi:hypothetical protein